MNPKCSVSGIVWGCEGLWSCTTTTMHDMSAPPLCFSRFHHCLVFICFFNLLIVLFLYNRSCCDCFLCRWVRMSFFLAWVTPVFSDVGVEGESGRGRSEGKRFYSFFLFHRIYVKTRMVVESRGLSSSSLFSFFVVKMYLFSSYCTYFPPNSSSPPPPPPFLFVLFSFSRP